MNISLHNRAALKCDDLLVHRRCMAASVVAPRIIKLTAEAFDLTPEKMSEPSRCAPRPSARFAAMYLLRRLTWLSLNSIGEELGGLDHATVSFGLGRVTEIMETEPRYAETVNSIERTVEGEFPDYVKKRTWPPGNL